MITSLLNNIERGKVIKLEEQNEEDVTYAKKINKLEAIADFNNSPEVLCQKIRAFNPFPMININFEGKSLKIVKAKIYNKEIKKNLAIGRLFFTRRRLIIKAFFRCLKIRGSSIRRKENNDSLRFRKRASSHEN